MREFFVFFTVLIFASYANAEVNWDKVTFDFKNYKCWQLTKDNVTNKERLGEAIFLIALYEWDEAGAVKENFPRKKDVGNLAFEAGYKCVKPENIAKNVIDVVKIK